MVDLTSDIRLEDAREKLAEGDVLLFRPVPLAGLDWLHPGKLIGRAIGAEICALGRTPYCHAGMLVDLEKLWVAEMRESLGRGGVRTLPEIVAAGDGLVDVYRPSRRDGFDVAKSVEVMSELIERRYDYRGIARSLAYHTPVLKMLLPTPHDRTEAIAATRPLYCSAAISYAQRVAGQDPVPNMPDELTEPGDLGRSRLYKPVGSLRR